MKVLVVGHNGASHAVEIAALQRMNDVEIISMEQVNESLRPEISIPIRNLHSPLKLQSAEVWTPRRSDNQPWKKAWKK